MNLQEATYILEQAVESHPKEIYARIKAVYSDEFRNVTPGLEYNKQIKREMTEFLSAKARLSGNIDSFMKQI